MADEYTLINDIYAKSLDERYADYDVMGEGKEIHKVVIDGNVFSGYKAFTFLWEKTFVKEPTRSSNGTIGNLNSYATFITPHLKIDFSLMSIDDYRRLYKLILQKNEFTVTCYDIVSNTRVTKKMYFAPDQFPTLYTVARRLSTGDKFIELTGIRNYTVELIGTNNELDLVSIVYLPNYPEGITPPSASQAEKDVYIGEEVVIGKSSTYPNNPPSEKYVFKEWKDQNGTVYSNGMIITVSEELILTAVWQPSTIRVLSFDYGVSEPVKINDSQTGEEIAELSREVTKGQVIGFLPQPELPKVKYEGADYSPYTNGEWWKTTVKVKEEEEKYKVTNNMNYWSERNDTIHWLVDKVQYTITFVANMDGYSLPSVTYGYQDKTVIPDLGKYGKIFKGWYTDEKFTKAFTSGTLMPPYDITLYAKWE